MAYICYSSMVTSRAHGCKSMSHFHYRGIMPNWKGDIQSDAPITTLSKKDVVFVYMMTSIMIHQAKRKVLYAQPPPFREPWQRLH